MTMQNTSPIRRIRSNGLYGGVLLACVFSLAPRLAFAQPSPTDQPSTTLKIQAREVVLPVTVRDKHGALVSSLQKTDFTLTEDGRPQTIKSFTRETDLPFLLGLLVDTSRSVSSAMESERKAAGKFVDQMLPADPKDAKAGDQAFLLHFDHEVELLEDFTNSRDKLHKELEEMGPSRAAQNDTQGPETTGDDRGSRPSTRRGGTQLYDAIFLAADELMKPKEGRKALVVFSDGADRGSKETLNEAVDAADRAGVAVYTVYFKGEQENNGFNNGNQGGTSRRHGRRFPGRRLSRRRWWLPRRWWRPAPSRHQERGRSGWQKDHGEDRRTHRRPLL